MKHPLFVLHLEAHCSIKLGELHLLTINTSRVNTVFCLCALDFCGFCLFVYFFSQQNSLWKETLLSKAQGQHKTFLGAKILNDLLSVRQTTLLRLASCFIVWQYSWLEAEIENHFPLLNFLVNSKRMVLIHQTSLGKCIANVQDLSPVVLKRGMWFVSYRAKSGLLQLLLHLVFATIDFHWSTMHQSWITENPKARNGRKKYVFMLWNHLGLLSELLLTGKLQSIQSNKLFNLGLFPCPSVLKSVLDYLWSYAGTPILKLRADCAFLHFA